MTPRELKDLLYEQVGRIGKAVASPKRLELLEILCQGEKSVDELAQEASISDKLASAHLKELRIARLVEARREGKQMIYRLVDERVAQLWVVIREIAEERLLELQSAMHEMVRQPGTLSALSSKELMEQARRGEVFVLDVRPGIEFDFAHLPYARSIPVNELKKRVNEIPRDKPVVAYCRGPFCLMAHEALDILNEAGIEATRIESGVAEWRAEGLPVSMLHEQVD